MHWRLPVPALGYPLPIQRIQLPMGPLPGPGPVVLLVERNHALRRLLCKLLTEEGGCRVLQAGSLRSAAEPLRSRTPIDVVVADGSPSLPCWEVVQEARWLRPGIPVVRLISSPVDALPVYGEDPATMILIRKPFVITDLLAIIRQLAGPAVSAAERPSSPRE
jgi:DNA-binding response OmpR family regulator